MSLSAKQRKLMNVAKSTLLEELPNCVGPGVNLPSILRMTQSLLAGGAVTACIRIALDIEKDGVSLCEKPKDLDVYMFSDSPDASILLWSHLLKPYYKVSPGGGGGGQGVRYALYLLVFRAVWCFFCKPLTHAHTYTPPLRTLSLHRLQGGGGGYNNYGSQHGSMDFNEEEYGAWDERFGGGGRGWVGTSNVIRRVVNFTRAGYSDIQLIFTYVPPSRVFSTYDLSGCASSYDGRQLWTLDPEATLKGIMFLMRPLAKMGAVQRKKSKARMAKYERRGWVVLDYVSDRYGRDIDARERGAVV